MILNNTSRISVIEWFLIPPINLRYHPYMNLKLFFIVYTTVLAMTAKTISHNILGNVLTVKITKKCLKQRLSTFLRDLCYSKNELSVVIYVDKWFTTLTCFAGVKIYYFQTKDIKHMKISHLSPNIWRAKIKYPCRKKISRM